MWREMPFDSCIKKIKIPPKVPKKLYMETGAYPVVSQEAVHISGYYDDPSKVFRVEKPVVIFGDHTRTCKYVDFDFIVGADGVKVFLPDESINSKYFYYFILANTPKDKGYARHYRFLKQLTVPIPPLAEQKRIVERLDKAFAEIDKGIEIAQECKTVASKISDASVKHALANQYFEWKTIDLGSIAENLDAKRVPITKSKRVEGDVPYYGASGIVDYVDGHLFDEELLLISEDGANLLMRAYPIAFPVSGKAWVNNHAHVLRFSDRNTQKWVERYLNATDLKKFISGMAQPKINQRKLNSIPIPLPNEKHMNELLSVIDMTKQKGDELNKVQTEKVFQLVQLKSAILAKELHPSKSEAA